MNSPRTLKPLTPAAHIVPLIQALSIQARHVVQPGRNMNCLKLAIEMSWQTFLPRDQELCGEYIQLSPLRRGQNAGQALVVDDPQAYGCTNQ